MLGDIAGLIAAIAFAILAIGLAYPAFKLGRLFVELANSVHDLSVQTEKALVEATGTVGLANVQLAKVDAATDAASQAAQDLSALVTLLSATVGRPLVKVAAFSSSVRRVVNRKWARK